MKLNLVGGNVVVVVVNPLRIVSILSEGVYDGLPTSFVRLDDGTPEGLCYRVIGDACDIGRGLGWSK